MNKWILLLAVFCLTQCTPTDSVPETITKTLDERIQLIEDYLKQEEEAGFSGAIMVKYQDQPFGDLPPHIYAVTNHVYNTMKIEHADQCLIIR